VIAMAKLLKDYDLFDYLADLPRVVGAGLMFASGAVITSTLVRNRQFTVEGQQQIRNMLGVLAMGYASYLFGENV